MRTVMMDAPLTDQYHAILMYITNFIFIVGKNHYFQAVVRYYGLRTGPRPIRDNLRYYSRTNSQEPVDEDTSRVTFAAPRYPVEQGVDLSPEKDIAKPVVSVSIFPKNTNFITNIRTGLIEADDDNAINLASDPNADTIFPDRVYLKRWKDLDGADARHIKVKGKVLLDRVQRKTLQ